MVQVEDLYLSKAVDNWVMSDGAKLDNRHIFVGAITDNFSIHFRKLKISGKVRYR